MVETQLEETELARDVTKSTSPAEVQTPEIQQQEEPKDSTEAEDEQTHKSISNWKHKSSHPKELIIGNINEGICIRSKRREESSALTLIFEIEPKSIEEALADECWIEAMQEELRQFSINDVCELILKPKGKSIIRAKWVFRNKVDEK